MHADEHRDPELTHRQVLNKEIADPIGLYTKYQDLLARQRRRERASAGQDETYSQWSGAEDPEKRDLKRRISSAHVALNGIKDENEELREKLEALRSSKTMKAGKLLSTPARAVNRATRRVKPAGRKALRQLKNRLSSPRLETVSESGRMNGEATRPTKDMNPAPEKKSASKSQDSSTERKAHATAPVNPIEEFEAKETQKSFERALNYHWYNLGEISETQAFIEANQKWAKEVSGRAEVLIRRVGGASRILRGGLSIPSRSTGAAYTAENDRVMYCVHSTPVFNSNGYSTRTRGVARGIVDAGGDVIVVGRSGYPWDSKADRAKPGQERYAKEIDGVVYVHNPGPNLNRDALDDYVNEVADTFVREAKLNRPSIIQAASNHRTALPALIAARRVGVPFIYEVRGLWEITEAVAKPGFEHTERFAGQKELETLVAMEADRVLAITSEVADELISRGVDRDKISIIPNAVDPNEFVPLPRDKKYATSKKYDPDLPTIGFAGSFVGYEGLDLLLDSSALLTRQGIKHQIVLAGSGGEEETLRDQAKTLGLTNVHFLGRLPQDEIVRLLSTFDIVACPRTSSRITELVSPLKPLESFATSTATVLSDVAPNRTLAGDQGDSPRAVTFPAGDSEALANVLKELIESPDRRRNLGRMSRLWVVRDRNWPAIGSKILEDHRNAVRHYDDHAVPGADLSELTVGVIADEFTRTSLQATFNAVIIDRNSWRSQLEDYPLDFLFVESAWEGNEGQWHRGVGFYSGEESADLLALIAECRERGIPTVFWNKEDPVHFKRFAPTAATFDHVFTTDANMIREYRGIEGTQNITVSSHSFYAQPALHNPLRSSVGFTPTVAYAGTYYGDRYSDRTRRLDALLSSSHEYGIDIYDRQADNPDSPYKFPPEYLRFVRGALPYQEIIQTYGAHLAHINVNSVEDSPTMFSRRVVEIPACGGVVFSAQGRGIAESLGSAIATSNEPHVYDAWLHSWSTDANSWFSERWRQMRVIYRSHTSSTALTILARTIGLEIIANPLPGYALTVGHTDTKIAKEIVRYSHRPAVISTDSITAEAKKILDRAAITVVDTLSALPLAVEWSGTYVAEQRRTYYEDLLTSTRYGDWSFIIGRAGLVTNHATPMVEVIEHSEKKPDLRRIGPSASSATGVALVLPVEEAISFPIVEVPARKRRPSEPRRILIAGHDLKFAGGLIDRLIAEGFEVDIDQWLAHNQHDEEESLRKLQFADVVFAEWGLGNAVWYSRHLQPHQRMLVRVHLQELDRPYLSRINHGAVDRFLFVGELIRRAAVVSHGVPEEKSVVVPNFVDTDVLNQPKHPGAERTLGLVGITPRRKRFDVALDVLEKLLAVDPSYKLRVKGKMPSDYPWMKDRPDEMAYYDEQLARTTALNKQFPGAVVFDGFDSDMAEWYRNIGIALSTSDFESFHFTIADGAASGARPASLNWPGADFVYPDAWLSGTPDRIAREILNNKWKESEHKSAIDFVARNYDQDVVLGKILELITSNI